MRCASPGTLKEPNVSTYRPVPHLKAYSRNEFARIFSATRRKEARTRSRLDTNHETLVRYRAGDESDGCVHVIIRGKPWSVGAILDYLQIHERLLRRELDR